VSGLGLDGLTLPNCLLSAHSMLEEFRLGVLLVFRNVLTLALVFFVSFTEGEVRATEHNGCVIHGQAAFAGTLAQPVTMRCNH